MGAPDFFAKTKINIGNFPLRHWKTIVILKIIRFQSLNFTSKPKGNNEIVEILRRINRRKKKATKPKRRSKLLKLEQGKVC